eukprot:tig00000262_g23065.t1
MAMGPRRVGVSRESNCYRGTHVKLVLGTVATALVRKRDAPELYSEVNPNGLCVLCGTRQQDIAGRPRLVAGTEETLEHMLTCLSAVAVEARAAAEASISAVVSGALAKPLQRSLPQALCNSLKVTRVNEPTLTPLERRTQICVLRGLPPAGLTDMVRETIPDEKLAAKVTRKLTTAIGEQAHKTWAARCKAYAEWEKECGITKVMKERRAKRRRTEARVREAAGESDQSAAGPSRQRRGQPTKERCTERCAACHALMSRHRGGGENLEYASLNCPPEDYGWAAAAEAMQLYDHTNRYDWGVGTARTRPR